jgi:hypothetical protein
MATTPTLIRPVRRYRVLWSDPGDGYRMFRRAFQKEASALVLEGALMDRGMHRVVLEDLWAEQVRIELEAAIQECRDEIGHLGELHAETRALLDGLLEREQHLNGQVDAST